jgi:hypothetical protein
LNFLLLYGEYETESIYLWTAGVRSDKKTN